MRGSVQGTVVNVMAASETFDVQLCRCFDLSFICIFFCLINLITYFNIPLIQFI